MMFTALTWLFGDDVIVPLPFCNGFDRIGVHPGELQSAFTAANDAKAHSAAMIGIIAQRPEWMDQGTDNKGQ